MFIGLLLTCSLGLAFCQNRVLVLLDSPAYTQTHSTFFQNLKDSGYDMDFKLSNSPDLVLQRFNEYLYDHVIVFAARTEEFGGMLNAKTLAKFVDAGGNVLLAGGSKNGEAIREFAAECGVRVDADSPPVLDGSDLNNSVMLTRDNLIDCEVITGETKRIIYSGGSIYFNRSNYLITPVLSANVDSYLEEANFQPSIYNPAVGRNIHLIASMQAKNNARVTILGSAEVFSDALMFPRNKQVDNEEFSKHIVDWTFQRSGVLRLSDVHHHLVGESVEPSFYTIREKAHFSFKLEELQQGQWKPFCVNDLQLEFIRIDPFIRQYMTCKDGVYSLDFEVPDVHGVYKYSVDYSKPGYSRVSLSKLIPVHPLRHDQYERFIPSAMPYYVTCASMLVGVFLLSFVILYHEDNDIKKKTL